MEYVNSDRIQHPRRIAPLSECRWLRFLYLAFFSQPAADRFLYRGLRRRPCRAIVEIGLGDGQRARRVLEVARRYTGAGNLRYTGIDLFESRPEGQTPLSLKQAYQRLHLPGVRLQLVPGDPWQALSRVANTLRDTDLLIIGRDQDENRWQSAWFFVPRMLSETARVYRERVGVDGGPAGYEMLSRADIEGLARVRRAG
jgi:hypothetical protein